MVRPSRATGRRNGILLPKINLATDYELLDRWADGDHKAVTELFGRYFDALYRFFRHKTTSEVDDLVQSTFEACVSGRERFRRESTFRTYLFATARYKLLNHYRARRDIADLSEIAESRLADLEPSPSAVVAGRQEKRVLLEALRGLPLDYQIIIELYRWENLTGPEVAEVLEISEAAMRSRLHRAQELLRSEIERLSASPELLHSTLANLDDWARSLRVPQ